MVQDKQDKDFSNKYMYKAHTECIAIPLRSQIILQLLLLIERTDII